jgi:hypothetical protein
LLKDGHILVQTRVTKQTGFGKSCGLRFTKNLQSMASGMLGLLCV